MLYCYLGDLMKNKVSSVLPRVNFFDGQRVTESDLDAEQLHNQSVFSGIINDFHGSGVVKNNIFDSNMLFDSSKPGFYAATGAATSKEIIEAGNYDGKPLVLDVQPSDIDYGNRLLIEPENIDMMGRIQTKVLIIGYTFNSMQDGNQIVYELITFGQNKPKLTKYYYTKVVSIIFNNFSGGIGRNEYGIDKESLNISSNGRLKISEADSFMVFPLTESSEQISSPSFDLLNFITYSNSINIENLIKEAIGDDSNFNDIYFELGYSKIAKFEKNSSVSTSFGQKFLANSETIQRIDFLMSVDADDSLPIDEQFDFSGDLVLSVHKLMIETRYPTDIVPENLIDFDPDIEPIMEISVGQSDLQVNGTILSDKESIVQFDFSSTLLADPSIGPLLEVGNFYAIVLSRRGDTSKGTINLFVGYDEPSRRTENGQPKNPKQEFANQESRYIEYDPSTRKWVDYSNFSLWHIIHSETLEVTSGTAYSDDGFLITIPKYEEYVGDTKISRYIKNIPLSSISSSQKNYITVQHVEKFTDPSTHPRTGNFVFTRILDTGVISVLNEADFNQANEESNQLLISTVYDKNVRGAEAIIGAFDKPGLIERDYILIISPDDSLLNSNLINRIFIPDTECSCGAKYRIIKTECLNYKLGDLNNDGAIDNLDIDQFLVYSGHTINSSDTEKKLLSGELSYIEFKQSDLNGDGTIDGTDLEYLELAIAGNISFTEQKEFKVLKLYIENITESSNNPSIFESSDLSGISEDATNNITFVVDDYRKGLAIRVGDIVSISDETVGAGLYIITSKTFDIDTLIVSVSLKNESGSEPEFAGTTGFDVSVFSGADTNCLADNLTISSLPFSAKNWKIDFINSIFSGDFFEVCDLRRFVSGNFIEERISSCLCNTSPCQRGELCGPYLKNQQYFPGDIYLTEGNILKAPGVPHHGDFEYVTITMPMPPGSIEDCQVDLYNTFIKSSGTSCLTSAGYQAMKYSDGTYVGCEDTGLLTDITRGRVKFTSAIASLHVDGLVDGYAVDGYADATSTSSVKDIVSESSIDHSYNSFSTWLLDAGNSSIVDITNDSGPNNPAIFTLTSETSSGIRYGMLNGPSEISSLTGDLLIDMKAFRSEWSSTYPQGNVSSYLQILVVNDDLSSTKLRLGWRQSGTSAPTIFWAGMYYNSSGTLFFSFESTATIPDEVGEEILFRVKRINDTFFAYYINPTKILDGTIPESFGQYIRIGSNPSLQPGAGSVSISLAAEQSDSPEPGLTYTTRFSNLQIRAEYSPAISVGDILISRDATTAEVSRAAISFPIMITRRTNIISAKMILTAAENISTTDAFNIIPLAIINASNLAPSYNYPVNQDVSYIQTFYPGSVSSGDTFEVDIKDLITVFLSEPGFLPGTYKALIIEPDSTTDSSILISPSMTFEIEYEDISTGVIFKVGVSIDPITGIASFKTKNILYDSTYNENRTTIKFGVFLKKAGFINTDVNVSISDLSRIGLGSCLDESNIIDSSAECYFVVGTNEVGTFVEGPFPCTP
jgi:hypothetical protein